MTTKVTIKNGVYRKTPVKDVTFTLLKDFTTGAKGNFVTVASDGYFGEDIDKVRITVDSIEDIEITGRTEVQAIPKIEESDEQVMERIKDRFSKLDTMTKGTISGDIRAMIVVGPPGVGKSYGVEYQLERAGMFEKLKKGGGTQRIKYEVVKGAMTAIGLYCTLFRFSDPNNVLVFDDCDSILMDDLSLNILKAALDSGKKRRIFWNSDSAMLRREGVPDQFDFKGSVIFITNINFDHVKSKRLQDHLAALQSRCHYLDLTLETMRDKFLRIKQIFSEGQLFNDYEFSPEVGDQILDFMDQNKHRLREMSLRMALKIADLTKISETDWKGLAETTCMRN